LKIEAEAEVLPIRADEGQLHQLLLNLCLNANDALGGEPGTITIRLARMRPERSPLTIGDLRLGRDYARLTVADTGAGIDMATLPRIFEPFFTTKERGRGTGLGLAVVHGIVTASGGALHVESVPGTGTTITIYLPLADSSPRPETASRPSPGEVRGRERILIVDDEPDLADMLAIGLERLGYEVASSNESREALQAFREDPTAWDVLVADQVMPGLKGTALIAAVKRLRPDLKAILHTGFGDGVTDTAARAQGADAVLHKPVEAQQVAACIRRLLDARETLRMC
jgi:CheY-like chemotaxis protein